MPSLPPRDARPVGRVVAWLVIAISVALLVVSNWSQSREESKTKPTTSNRPDMQVELLGRYAVGVHSLLSRVGKPDPSAQILIAQVEQTAASREDKLAAVVIAGELLGQDEALDRLGAIVRSKNGPATQPVKSKSSSTTAPIAGAFQRRERASPTTSTTAPKAQRLRDEFSSATSRDPVASALETIYTQGPQNLTAEKRELLIIRLGWFGKLAQSYGKPNDDPQRAAVLSAARRTVAAIGVAMTTVVIGFIAGLVLLIVFLVRIRDRKLQLNYHPTANGTLFLEAFAIYIGGMTMAGFVANHLPALLGRSLVSHLSLMVIPTIAAIAWPLWRGAGIRDWRTGLGWHAGRGVLREIGLGLVGYVAGLPVLAAGFAITFFLIKTSGATPTHPIQHMVGEGTRLTLLAYFLASLYAPVTEETMFRGAFFNALRGRHGWIVSTLITSFVFAAIHPQGWTLIPTLMAIAIVFAGIREWRSTILSSAAAHCVHNTLTLTFLIMVMT